MDSKDHMAGVLANTLLYSEENRDKLMELVWSQWTPEQRQVIADEAFRVAQERMKPIIERKLNAVGTQTNGRTNMFARHVETTVRKVFETDEVKGTVERVTKEHLEETLTSLPTIVKTMAAEFVTKLVRELFNNLDSHTLRSAVNSVLPKGE